MGGETHKGFRRQRKGFSRHGSDLTSTAIWPMAASRTEQRGLVDTVEGELCGVGDLEALQKRNACWFRRHHTKETQCGRFSDLDELHREASGADQPREWQRHQHVDSGRLNVGRHLRGRSTLRLIWCALLSKRWDVSNARERGSKGGF